MPHVVATIEHLETLRSDLQAEVSLEQPAALREIEAAPALKEVSVKHAATEVIADLVARVVVAVIDSLVHECSSFQVLF